jgi:hypothetical protein
MRRIDNDTAWYGQYAVETPTPDPWPDAVRIAGYPAACVVSGYEVEPDEDTEWSGCYNRTGSLVARMVGDDHYFVVEPEDIAELAREDYCGECGQIGCACDGYDRTADDDDETEAAS